jgi:gluconokinase
MVIAVDVGTSSTRAALYDLTGRAVAGRFHRVLLDPVVTADGGVEHDPDRLLEAVATCVDAVLGGARPGEVAAVAVTTFWHGLCGFDSGQRPVTPVYMWADTRSAAEAALLRGALDEAAVHRRTGCHLHASYWPAKLRWLARAHPDTVGRVARWGSFGEHLELALFGDAATTISLASGTGLLDQERLRWDPEALAAAGLDDRHLFPLGDRRERRLDLRPPWARRWPALRGVPWFPAVADGAASNVGSGCLGPARIALNIGTSAAMRLVLPSPPAPGRGLWRYRLDRRWSVVGGATSEGGNVYAWCRRVLQLPDDGEVERRLAAPPADGPALTVLPFLAGERSPGWREDRRGVIAGLTLETTALDIVRAALDAVAFRLALVYELLAPCAAPEHEIVVSGGAIAGSRAWARIIADVLGRAVTLSPEDEATSRGAALLALEVLGHLPELATTAPVAGDAIVPDAARHARYREALARHRRLAETV